MSPTVLVPVKRANPKGRLSGILGLAERRELVKRMLKDVFGTLEASGFLKQTYVVSSDRDIFQLVSGLGAGSITEATDLGVNEAVETGMSETRDAEGWLVLPADIPFLTKQDLSKVLEFYEAGIKIVLSPSRKFDGTNLLLIGRGTRLKLSYDRDSFSSHLAAAARSGYSVAAYCSRTVTLDIDSVEDIRLALASGVRNATTTFLKSKLAKKEG